MDLFGDFDGFGTQISSLHDIEQCQEQRIIQLKEYCDLSYVNHAQYKYVSKADKSTSVENFSMLRKFKINKVVAKEWALICVGPKFSKNTFTDT